MDEHDPKIEPLDFPEVEFSENTETLYRNIMKTYSAGKKSICEIGTGVSTEIFANSVAKTGGHVWTIDVKNRPGVAQWITIISEDSSYLIWTRPLDLLYLDGNHEAQHVRKELIIYGPCVAPGGYILLDDCRHDGKRTTKYLPDDLIPVVEEFCWLNGLKWQFCAPEPNKIVAIKVHKSIGAGQ